MIGAVFGKDMAIDERRTVDVRQMTKTVGEGREQLLATGLELGREIDRLFNRDREELDLVEKLAQS